MTAWVTSILLYRIPHTQGWPKPYICTAYGRIYVYMVIPLLKIPYIVHMYYVQGKYLHTYGSGQPYAHRV
jgi:hypothetical protein